MQAVKPNWHNRTLFQGDNLEFMQSMNSQSVHLIATDPPFNKGKDFHATPESLAAGASFDDRWSWDEVRDSWVDSIQDDHPAAWAVIDWSRMTYGDDMGAFLCFMAARLIEMRRVLRDDGSIYLHCDPTASHYLKALMDAVFGRQKFRNDIVWKRFNFHADAKRFGAITDRILFYGGGNIFNPVRVSYSDSYVESKFTHEDEDGRRYRLDNLNPPGGRGPVYEFHGVTKPWRMTKDKIERLEAEGRIYTKSRVPQLKRYLDEMPGQAIADLWTDISPINPRAKERTGYPTQKPLELYRRIIRASSNPGDIVFDPFAGCATTCVAAEAEGRQWVAADSWEGTLRVTQERLETLARPAGTGETSGLRLYPVVRRTEPLVRTDEGEVSAPPLKSVFRKRTAPTMKRKEMLAALIERDGLQCQGCGFVPPHKRHLEIDHKLPRSEGGSNDLDNRVLLCGPCNRAKSNTLTLTGLRKQNERDGLMASGGP